MKVKYEINSGKRTISLESDTDKTGCWLTFDESKPEIRTHSLSPEEGESLWRALGSIFGLPRVQQAGEVTK